MATRCDPFQSRHQSKTFTQKVLLSIRFRDFMSNNKSVGIMHDEETQQRNYFTLLQNNVALSNNFLFIIGIRGRKKHQQQQECLKKTKM